MAPTCNICGILVPTINRYKLTAKIPRKHLTMAEFLSQWGVPLSKEEERLLICRTCRYCLSSAASKQQEFNVCISKLYNKSAPTSVIGRKLREFISTLVRGEVSILTPSSTSSCVCRSTPHGQKRSRSTIQGPQDSEAFCLKKPRFSGSSEKTTQTGCREIQSHPIPTSTRGQFFMRSEPLYSITMDRCITCGTLQEEAKTKRKKTLAAYIVHTNVKVGTALQDMGLEVGSEKLWSERIICAPCLSIVGRWTNLQLLSVSISCDWQERTGCPLPTLKKTTRRRHRTRKKERFVSLVDASKYRLLLKELRECRASREAWFDDLKKKIRQDIKSLERDESLFAGNTDENGSTELVWDEVLEKIKSKAPVLFAVMYAAVSRWDDPTRYRRSMNKHGLMKSRLGMMFFIPFHHRRPRYHKIPRDLPLTIARTLIKCRTTSKTKVPTNNKLGSTQPVTLSSTGFTKKSIVASWQTSIKEEKTARESGTLLAGENLHPGYSLIMDNVSRKSQDNDHPVCNAFAVKNRVSFRELQEDTTVKARDLPLKIYLPSQEDYEELRMRMRVLVERILKANLEVFTRQSTLEHIPHQYSKECSRKSEYVDLGIIEDAEDPYNAEGMQKILTNLSKLVPDGYDMPLHGDQDAVTLVRSARKTASKKSSTKKHIHQLHPVPQDLRAVIVRDTISELFTPTQASEKGTLKHLKEYFGHRSVNDQVWSFRHTEEFLLFITCAFVVGFASEILGKSRSKTKPQLGPIADEVVRHIWYQVPMNKVADILNAPVEFHDDQFCYCKQDLEEADMIECCNIDCPNGRWFHHGCVMEVETEGEWFCSPECEQSNMGQFCICRQKGVEGTDLMWTCANKSCQRGAHFHNRCIRSTLTQPEGDDWYCSAECAVSGGEGGERDELLDYLQRVTWCCLFGECIRDAEREGDGTASMGYWRISMPEMFARGHDKHVAATHRLLAGTSGCFPPRIREEVTHNRTINLHGGKGKNVSLDFSTEQLNNLKEASRNSQGENTPQTRPKVSGASSNLSSGVQRFARYHEDVKKFLCNFGDMFCEMRGRIIPSMCSEKVGQEITQDKATDLKKCLLRLNKKFDKEMRVKHQQNSSE